MPRMTPPEPVVHRGERLGRRPQRLDVRQTDSVAAAPVPELIPPRPHQPRQRRLRPRRAACRRRHDRRKVVQVGQPQIRENLDRALRTVRIGHTSSRIDRQPLRQSGISRRHRPAEPAPQHLTQQLRRVRARLHTRQPPAHRGVIAPDVLAGRRSSLTDRPRQRFGRQVRLNHEHGQPVVWLSPHDTAPPPDGPCALPRQATARVRPRVRPPRQRGPVAQLHATHTAQSPEMIAAAEYPDRRYSSTGPGGRAIAKGVPAVTAQPAGRPRLRELRRAAGWTQQELADKLAYLAWTRGQGHPAVNADMIAKWERGEKGISARYRLLLCELFGVTPEQLGVVRTAGAAPAAPDPVRDPDSLVSMLDQAAVLLDQLGAPGKALAPQLLSAWKDTATSR